jgi:hypothetical protein
LTPILPYIFWASHLAQFLLDDAYHLSIITEIELLSYSWLTEAMERQIRSVLSEITIVGLTDPSRDAAIDLRRRLERKISNAVIVVSLSPERVAEVEDFINFIRLRNQNHQMRAAATRTCQLSFERIWDNPDDAAYDRYEFGDIFLDTYPSVAGIQEAI